MNKLLDIYIIKKFFSKFFFIMVSFLTIFFIVDIIDNLDKFIEQNISNNEIINYYLFSLPWFVSIALPMTVLISTVFCFTILNKNNELTALKASGISINRISLPIILSAIIISVLSFYFDNLIVVDALQKKSIIEKKLRPYKKIKTTKKENIFYHLNNAFLKISKYNYKDNTGRNVSIQKYNGSDLDYRIDAKNFQWIENSNLWSIQDVEIRTWVKNNFIFHTIKDTSIHISDITPEIIKKDFINPEEMNYWDLSLFIEKLRNKGLKYNRWSVNKHFKTAFACSPLIMVLFGIALSIQKPRTNFTTGIGLSILVIFLYYLFIKAGQTLGYNNTLPPFLSIWLVNFLFLSTGTYLFIKSRT